LDTDRRAYWLYAGGMSDSNAKPSQNGAVFRIVVREHLDASEAEWFDGFTLSHTRAGATCLEGAVADQTALRGVLDKIFALGLTLLVIAPVRRN
jgi:hypothetical protein